jgi:phosphohistidine phosphatase
MQLYIMRHGPAEDAAATGRDADRALTSSGRDRVRSVAKLLGEQEELPLRILSSPLLRAEQTAEIVAATAKAKGWSSSVEKVPELSPEGKNVELIQKLLQAEATSAMVVGHEPDLSGLVLHLLTTPAPLPMDKATVVALEVRGDGPASLRFIIEPRAVALVHDARQRSRR